MPHTVHGLVPILATPFQPDGTLDLPSLRRLTEFQLVSGVDGVAVFGMASENFALTAAERAVILREVTGVVAGAVPVVAGVGATGTVPAIEQVVAAEAGGASALMVLPPYLVKPGPAQLVDFYADVAAAAGIEVMAQDAPGATGVQLPVPVVVELSKLPRVTSVKVEAPPTAPKVAAVVDAVADPEFAVLGGQNAQFCLAEYAGGGVGTMPACEFPDLLAPVLADWTAGRTDDARAAFRGLLPLVLCGLQQGVAWAIHKEVLVRRGIIDHATVRAPAAVPTAATLAELDAVLADLGLG
ncbi:MAG: dihydrodipicolinate synthase family protein [Actinophytocola sp.]|uniref:dihydrodipicolinate synthase family protein n=1 Tax=Actinophytocola sp. TaxID=1872138 RepID=UPI00132A6A02|nr:dihydrodipicolinate synthase family protein [Actinophytocola sp.]MPZ82175.1 dihydrodipicolinate synthase family protein [Actinophytocola sp.]